MLPKQRRIQRKEFQSILSGGRRLNSPHLLAYISKQGLNSETKFAFSVSKKVLKLASSRNTWRRRGYSIIQKYIGRIPRGFLCFFSFKKGLNGLKFAELEKEIIELLIDAHVLT